MLNRYNNTTLNNSKIPFMKPVFDINKFKQGDSTSGFFPNGGLLNIIPSQFSPKYNNLKLYKQSKYLNFGGVIGDYFKGMGDTFLSTLGMTDVIKDKNYKTKFGKGFNKFAEGYGKIMPAVAGAINPAAGAILGATQGLGKLATSGIATEEEDIQSKLDSDNMARQQAMYDRQRILDKQINPQNYTGYDVKSYFNANGGYLFNTPYKNGGLLDGNNLSTNELIQYGLLKDGGKIYIKPENRGKFTAYKERTGKTTEEALHSPNAHIRQMANFARNASKWNKQFGGQLMEGGEVASEPIGDKNTDTYTQQYFDMIRNRMNPNAVNLTNKVNLGEMKSGGILGNPLSDTRSGMGYFVNKNRLYAFGGSDAVTLPKQNEVPLDDNASIATNDAGTTEGTHETGENIPVSNESGQTGNYVEPGEVILKTANGNYALSKRLGFADKYMQLLATKALLENNTSATNDFTKNENKRNISAIDSKINKLPEEQEALKSKLNLTNQPGNAAWGDLLPTSKSTYTPNYESFGKLNDYNAVRDLINLEPNYRTGLKAKLNTATNINENTINPTNTTQNRNLLSGVGDFFKNNNITGNKVLDYATPFIDNIGNFFLTKNTPEIPKPNLNTAPVLETRIDDSAQKNTISDTAKAYNKYIDYNVGDITQRLANRRAMLGESTDKLNLINEATSTSERTARNTNRLYAYQNTVANNALLDAYDTAVAARKAGMQQDYSKNLGNIEENIQELQNRRDLEKYQAKQLIADAIKTQDSTIYRDIISNNLLDFKDTKTMQLMYDMLSKAFKSTGNTDNKTVMDLIKSKNSKIVDKQ